MHVSSSQSNSNKITQRSRNDVAVEQHEASQVHEELPTFAPIHPQTSAFESSSQSTFTHTRSSSNMTTSGYDDAYGMLSLMRKKYGRMQGFAYFRRNERDPWSSSHCSIGEDGNLRSRTERAETLLATLLHDLRGCRVRAFYDDFVREFVLHIRSIDELEVLFLRPHQNRFFNDWFAAILCWQPLLKDQKMQPQTKRAHLERLQNLTEHEIGQTNPLQSGFLGKKSGTITACIATFIEIECRPSSAVSSSASSSPQDSAPHPRHSSCPSPYPHHRRHRRHRPHH